MKSILRVALLALCLACSTSNMPETIAPTRDRLTWPDGAAVEIPLVRAGDHLFLNVRINGSDPLAFLLDTGADVTFLDPQIDTPVPLTLTASDLTIGGIGAERRVMSFAEGVELSVGGLVMRDQRIVALDTAEIEQALGTRIDGFLGWDMLRHFQWELDFQTRTLRIHRERPLDWPVSGWIPLGPKRTIPVSVSIADHIVEGDFALDTGGEGFLTVYPNASRHVVTRDAAPTLESRGIGGNLEMRYVMADRVDLAGTAIENVPVALTGGETSVARASHDGHIGLDTLGLFRLLVDGPAERVHFIPTGLGPSVAPRVLIGIALAAEGETLRDYRIQSVTPDSPAEAAGLQPGDLILEVDGRDASAMLLPEVRDLMKEPRMHRIVVRRGDEVLTVSLEPRVYD